MAWLNKLQLQVFGRITESKYPDFKGLDIVNIWSSFRTNIHASGLKAIAVVNGSNIRYVGWDSDGFISLASPLYSLPTDATPIGTLGSFSASSNVGIRSIYEAINNVLRIDTATLDPTYNPLCTTGSNLLTKNGIAYFGFSGNVEGIMNYAGAGNPILASGNNFSVTIVSSNNVSDNVGVILNTTDTNVQRFVMHNNRSNTKISASVRDTIGTNSATLVSQLNSADSRITTVTMNGSAKEFKLYLNDVLQDTKTFSTSYQNTKFRIGGNVSNGLPLNGTIQAIIISDTIWSGSQVTDVVNRLKIVLGL
jgi:hypothetical protein